MKIYIPAIIIIFFDQLTKLWIKKNLVLWESINVLGSYLRFTYVRNPGIAFGISVGEFQFIVALLSIAATMFIAYLHWQERNNHPLIVAGLSLILGGAIGNLIDRSYIFFVDNYRGVVDFIDIGIGSARWYIFNIADSAVSVGVLLYLLHSILVNNPKLINDHNG